MPPSSRLSGQRRWGDETVLERRLERRDRKAEGALGRRRQRAEAARDALLEMPRTEQASAQSGARWGALSCAAGWMAWRPESPPNCLPGNYGILTQR